MKILLFAAMVSVTGVFAQSDSVETEPQYFGECYSMFNCQGAAMGSFPDTQCRRMGGHSMMVGAMCMPL